MRPAWQHSQDTSTVRVRLSAASTDAEFLPYTADYFFYLDPGIE